MGSNYKNYIDYLIKLLLLKGCFVIGKFYLKINLITYLYYIFNSNNRC